MADGRYMNEIQSFSEIIAHAFSNIQVEDARKALNIYDEWKKILCRIQSSTPNEGQKLACHSRIIDFKNGILLVEADHPGWITLLQFHKKYIVKGLNLAFPNLKVRTLAFRIKGTRDALADSVFNEDDARKELEKRLEKEEDANRAAGISQKKKYNQNKECELPDELKNIFESWQNSAPKK